MTIMTTHGSASVRNQAPHAKHTTRTNTILNALTQRAQAMLNDESIDPESRAVLRYAMETHDPWLAKFVRRAEAGETLFDANGSLVTHDTTHDTSETDSNEKIEALAELIFRYGEQASAALFVLMAKIENAKHPAAVAHSVKHLAFTRCGEFNLGGIVDAQVKVIERELLENGDTPET
jgi:hypothetical protein